MDIEKYKAIRLTIPISSTIHELLAKSAKVAGRSKQDEALLRIVHSLYNEKEIIGSYWDIAK
ncbi:TraY domain-containing protein [Providencia rettgeri]|nr:TraY domain-containing protein [Providencia rettgeri]